MRSEVVDGPLYYACVWLDWLGTSMRSGEMSCEMVWRARVRANQRQSRVWSLPTLDGKIITWFKWMANTLNARPEFDSRQ